MDLDQEKELFERTPVPRAILRLALPSVVGQIILVVYNMADTFFVAQTGSDAMITAVRVCMPAFMFLSAITNLFGVGGSSVISQALGKKEPERAGRASAFALAGCALTAGAYALLPGFWPTPLWTFWGAGRRRCTAWPGTTCWSLWGWEAYAPPSVSCSPT